DLLRDLPSWDRLKRVLRDRAVAFEDAAGPLDVLSSTLEPVPVPIATRVILLGPEHVYSALVAEDPDFSSLFRVKVEVDPDVRRTPDALVSFDGYLMSLAEDRGWLRFDRQARARLLDVAARVAGDREHLSLLLPPLEETCAFAS